MNHRFLNGAIRATILLPFLIAFTLNVAHLISESIHSGIAVKSERIAGLAFLFSTPFASVVDLASNVSFHSRWANAAWSYVCVQWLPAALYALILFVFCKTLMRWRRVTNESSGS